MKLTITKDEAKFIHQKFYNCDFEVVEIKRSGVFDTPPFSFFYGLSDLGSWDGLMSTDGNKVVVTKSSFMNSSKVSQTFEFTRKDVEGMKWGIFKTTFSFKTRFKGLTKIPPSYAILFLALSLVPPFLGWVLYFVIKGKVFQFRPSNNFENLEKFSSLLKT